MLETLTKLIKPEKHQWHDVPGIVEAVNIGGWPEWRQMQICECGKVRGRYTKITLSEVLAALNNIRDTR